MGNLYTRFFSQKSVRILILGLDASGKTTTLYRLKLGEVVQTIPTIGFNVESLDHKGINIIAWDIGGRDKSRPLQRHYYPNTDGIVWIVDSNDPERFREVKDEINRLLDEDELWEVPMLVLANKQDLPDAVSVPLIAEKLDLHSIRKRPWYIVPISAIKGEGIYEGLDWLASQMGYKVAKQAVQTGVESAKQSINQNNKMVCGWNYLSQSLEAIKNVLWQTKVDKSLG